MKTLRLSDLLAMVSRSFFQTNPRYTLIPVKNAPKAKLIIIEGEDISIAAATDDCSSSCLVVWPCRGRTAKRLLCPIECLLKSSESHYMFQYRVQHEVPHLRGLYVRGPYAGSPNARRPYAWSPYATILSLVQAFESF